MSEWSGALLFGLDLMAFVLGMSSLIMSFLPKPVQPAEEAMRDKIEYGFFGTAGIVLSVLFGYALSTI